MPVCDACGRDHSDRCEDVEFEGRKFKVCGTCISDVRKKPADYLAGKKETGPGSTIFDVCRD